MEKATNDVSTVAMLHDIEVQPIPVLVAKEVLEREHYLHSFPGGTMLCFGVFHENQLLGALTFGAGPCLAYSLVEGALQNDCATLSRLWLSDRLPSNSESRVIGIVLRSLRRYTRLKFLVSYADPTQGHLGVIYQATNWLYTGLSAATPLYELGGAQPVHSRSLAQVFGTHSLQYLKQHGIQVKLVPQTSKYRYIYFLDRSWQSQLIVPVLPYPKKEEIK